MRLEDQVVSLELAIKLKKLGFNQESHFNWVEKWHWDGKTHEGKSWTDGEIYLGTNYNNQNPRLHAHAYTDAELGELLPVTLTIAGKNYFYLCNKTNNFYRCGYEDSTNQTWARINDSEPHLVFTGKTEVAARAKMLIYLKENNLLPKSEKDSK